MTIDSSGIVIVVHCDECPDEITTNYSNDDFGQAIAEAKSKGWRVYKDKDGDWCHACPSCVEDFAQRDRDD